MRATMDQWTSRRSARPAVRLGAVGMAFFLSVSFSASLAETGASTVEAAAGCRIYVASGDDVTNGKAMDDNASRYPEKLLADKIKAPGWCLYNQGKNGQTSATYITGGGLASAYNMRPDFLTIQLGEQNSTIVNLVTELLRQGQGPRLHGRDRLRVADPGQQLPVDEPEEQLHDDPPADQDHGRPAAPAGRRRRELPEPVPAVDGRRRRDRDAVRPARRHDPDLHDPLGPAAAGAAGPRQGLPEAQPDAEGIAGAVPGRPERQPLGLRRHVPQVQGPLHDHEGHHQDQGRAPGGDRAPSTSTTRPRSTSAAPRSGSSRAPTAPRSRTTSCRPRSASSSSGARPPRAWASTRTPTATSASRTRSGKPTRSIPARRP